MDKKIRMAFSGFLHGKRRADFAGENPAEYLAPEVNVCDFALENGFSLSVRTESLGFGYSVPDGDGENYADGVSTTEVLTGAGSF